MNIDIMEKLEKSVLVLVFTVIISIFFIIFPGTASAANIEFTQDAELNFSSLATSTYVKSGSECDSLITSSSTLTAEIPAGSSFTIGTASLDSLKVTPSNASATLSFSQGNISSDGFIIQWTVAGNSTTSVGFVVKVAERDVEYLVTVDDEELDYYVSAGRQISFSYADFSSKTFKVDLESRGGGEAAPPPVPPEGGFKITIEDGANITRSREVNINLYGGQDIYRVRVTEETGGDNRSFRVYDYVPDENGEMEVEYILSAGEGEKEVRVQFRERYSAYSEDIVDTISYEPEGEPDVISGEAPSGGSDKGEEEVKEEYQGIVNFTRDLKLGDSGPDVKKLQEYLNSQGFIVAQTGPGSPGNETEYFGSLTKEALIRFQEAYKNKILSPLGLTRGTGYFGKATRDYINGTAGVEKKTETPQLAGGFVFEGPLKQGDESGDVKQLQILLNSDPDTKLADGGVGSPGNETEYFGSLTKSAVIRFQEKYRAETLDPWNIDSGTGYVGTTTMAKLNELLNN